MKNCVINKNYFNLYDNSAYALMNDTEKMLLLDYLKTYHINFRHKLKLQPNSKFGIEIEFDDNNHDYSLQNYNEWFQTIFSNHENFVNKNIWFNNGWRIKEELYKIREFSSPVFDDSYDSYLQIKKIYQLLNKKDIKTSNQCALQVSISAQVFKHDPKRFINFLKLYCVFEDVLFRFGLMGDEELRPLADTHAKNISVRCLNYLKKKNRLNEIITDFNSFITNITYARYLFDKFLSDKTSSLSFADLNLFDNSENYNRVEFRFPNATLDYLLVQNTINTLVKLAECNAENSLIKYYEEQYIKLLDIHHYNKKSLSNKPNEISGDINKILALGDIIFDNNLDKLNYLKQVFMNKEDWFQEKIKTKKVKSR